MNIEFIDCNQASTEFDCSRISTDLNLLFGNNKTDEIDIAVAYITEKGYRAIKNKVDKFLKKKERRIRVVVSLSDISSTESGALTLLLNTQKKYPVKFQVKYHCPINGEFHPKLYIAKTKSKITTVILGSSNLTIGGLENNSEANVLINLSPSEQSGKFATDVQNFYDGIWNSASALEDKEVKAFASKEAIDKEIRKKMKDAQPKEHVTKTILPNIIKKIDTAKEPYHLKTDIAATEKIKIYGEIDNLVRNRKWTTKNKFESAYKLAYDHQCSTIQILGYKSAYTKKDKNQFASFLKKLSAKSNNIL